MYQLYQGDCLEVMKQIPDKSVDMVLADLPYGTTACSWDSVIPLEPLWGHYKRLTTENRAVVLFAAIPFTFALYQSNVAAYRYSWIWNKHFSGSFVQAKRMPMRVTEDVLVFSFQKGCPQYFPQMINREKPITKGKVAGGGAIPIAQTEASEILRASKKTYDQKFPSNILDFSNRTSGDRGLHPTQKPVALMEYLIKTYTNPGDTVLDNTMGSGTTGVAAMNLGRKFIGIEQDPKYFAIAENRIKTAFEESIF